MQPVGAKARLFVPAHQLPQSLRSYMEQVARQQHRTWFFPDHSRGLASGQTWLLLLFAVVIGLMPLAGLYGLVEPLFLGLYEPFWWWFTLALILLVAPLALALLVMGLARVVRGARTSARLWRRQWRQGLYLLPEVLIYEVGGDCHVIPRSQVVGVGTTHDDDLALCPALSVRYGDQIRDVALTGHWRGQWMSTLVHQLRLWQHQGAPWLSEEPQELVQAPQDGRAHKPGHTAAAEAREPWRQPIWEVPEPVRLSAPRAFWRALTLQPGSSRKAGALSLEDGVLEQATRPPDPRGADQIARLELARDFNASLSCWLISDEQLELSVQLRQRDASDQAQVVRFRVRLPQARVSDQVALKQDQAPFVAPEDFARLWPVLVFYAQAHGLRLGDLVAPGADHSASTTGAKVAQTAKS